MKTEIKLSNTHVSCALLSPNETLDDFDFSRWRLAKLEQIGRISGTDVRRKQVKT